MSSSITLQALTLTPPRGFDELIGELGDGESGFGGTSLFRGEVTREEFLKRCLDQREPSLVGNGRVPQTIFLIVHGSESVVGMVRMRHSLNDALRFKGGHIGYYVRPVFRGNGFAREALRLALEELRTLGEKRALVTVDSHNLGSIKVVEGCGGVMECEELDPSTGKPFRRYWIDL